MLFRASMLLTVMFSTALFARAQGPAGETADVVTFTAARSVFVGEDLLPRVQAVLNLTEVQASAVRALVAMRTEAMQQIGQESAAAHARLEELMAHANPNPSDVGAAFLATRTVQEKFRSAGEKFKTDVQALLNAEQRSTLANLTAAADRIETLRMFGLIDSGFAAAHLPIPMHTERAIRIERAPFVR